MQNTTRFVPTTEVLRRTGISRTNLNSQIKRGLFLEPVKIGVRNIAWPEHELEALLRFLISNPSQDELKAFVARTHDARTNDEVVA